MHLDQLQLVIEIAKNHSISRASENLYISRQNASQSLQRLETELGIKIFERSKNGTQLTTEGEIVYQHALKVIDEISALKLNLNNYLLSKCQNYLGAINIYFSQLYIYFVPAIAEKICSYFPNALLQVSSLDYDLMNETLIKTNIPSLYFSVIFESEWESFKEKTDLIVEPLTLERLCLCCSKNNAKKFNKEVEKKELTGLPFALFSSTNNSSPQFYNYLSDSQNIKLSISLLSNNVSLLENNIIKGTHYGFSYLNINKLNENFVIIPIKDIEPMIFFTAYNAADISPEIRFTLEQIVNVLSIYFTTL